MTNGFIKELSTEQQAELLQFMSENGINDMQRAFHEMHMSKKQAKLSDLTYRVKIWQGTDKTKRWRAKFYLGDKERIIAGKMHGTKEDIENSIYDEIKAYEDGLMVTFKEAYEGYIAELKECKSDSENIVRIERTYESYFKEWGETPVRNIDVKKIKIFFKDTITEKKLTLKEFNKVYSVMLHSLLKAKDMEYIEWPISKELADLKKMLKSKKNLFRKKTRTNEELVFTDEGIDKLAKVIAEWGYDMKNLCILLMFKIGTRPGEHVALTYADVHDEYVSISKQEVGKRNGGKTTYVIKYKPKTDAGNRIIPYPGDQVETKKILNRIKELNPDGMYLFMEKGSRLNQKQIRDRLKRLCSRAGIVPKSPNKIRKTYASMLYENGVIDTTAAIVLGHEDSSTTTRFYVKNRQSNKQIIDQLKLVNF